MTKSLKSIDWTLLHQFLIVFEQGSMSAAVSVSGVSQPTLARQIERLESQLNLTLFERTGRGLSPTKAAQAIYPFVKEMEQASNEALLQLQLASSSYAGTVRISTTRDVAAYCLPKLFSELKSKYPKIHLEIVASEMQSNLLQREADIAIRLVRPTQAGLITRKLGELPFGIYAHSRYLKTNNAIKTPADLLSHTLIGFDNLDFIIKGFAQSGLSITPAQFALRTDDVVCYWEALRSGFGIGFIAAYITKQETEIQRVLPSLALPALSVWLTTHQEMRGNENIRVVYDFLAERFMSTVN